jgi:hypothetical protein
VNIDTVPSSWPVMMYLLFLDHTADVTLLPLMSIVEVAFLVCLAISLHIGTTWMVHCLPIVASVTNRAALSPSANATTRTAVSVGHWNSSFPDSTFHSLHELSADPGLDYDTGEETC